MTDPTIAARLAPTGVTPPVAVPPIPAPPAGPINFDPFHGVIQQPVAPVAPVPAPGPTTPINLDPFNPTNPSNPGTPSTPGTPAMPGTPGTPTAPVQGNELNDLVGGWQVTPSQITTFASAVQQVRSDLDTVFGQVNQLTSPAYLPQLGSSPVGQALTQKFLDRLSGGQGLLSHLSTVLLHLDQFVSNAEQAAQAYQETEQVSTDTMKSL